MMKIKKYTTIKSLIVSLSVISCFLVSPASWAKDKVNPDDEHQLMRREYFSDPTGTDQWDMEQYIAYEVVIHEFIYPSFGYASIVFSKVENPEAKYMADTQLVSELKNKGIKKSFIKKGSRAIIYGWPKTQKNRYGSIMLVDEIELIKKNGRNEYGKFYGKEKGVKSSKSRCDLCLGEDKVNQVVPIIDDTVRSL